MRGGTNRKRRTVITILVCVFVGGLLCVFIFTIINEGAGHNCAKQNVEEQYVANAFFHPG
jgi:hypothetical protein